ncbi:MAG TPA: NTP transferase domain-containing protein [Allosphingosinicella sp.]|nr:NTP transferase domain-containing protein [Allosphingosinicella sp.]
MKCLILAAGQGSRMRPLSASKPLTPVCGTPLIEHVIRRAAAAGAAEFLVVTGHCGERVEAFLDGLSGRIGLPVRALRTADWSRPNGFSVVTGAAEIAEPYLLLMADHLFDPAIARRLLTEASAGRDLVLAVDRNCASPSIDLDDATRVETAADGAIVCIGKGLDRYNAVDTGIFLATPALREAILEDIAAGGGGSLSEGVQRLADRRSAHTIDIGSRWWIDVDDPPSHRRAEAALAGAAPAP